MGKDLFSSGKARNIQAALGPEGLVEEGQSGFFPVTPEEKPLEDFQGPVRREKKHLALTCRPWGPLGRGRSERDVRDYLLNVLVWKAPKDLPCWKLSDGSSHPECSPQPGKPILHPHPDFQKVLLPLMPILQLPWVDSAVFIF